MKRILSINLIFILLFGTVACSKKLKRTLPNTHLTVADFGFVIPE